MLLPRALLVTGLALGPVASLPLSLPVSAAGPGVGAAPQAPPSAAHAGPRLAAPASGVWPLAPRPHVVAGFDPPASRFGPGHRGVDLAGHPGQAVRSALPGRVAFAGRVAGRGVVVVDHGTTRTTYEPVAPTVHVGDLVPGGAVIGRLQLPGSHCFPGWCLHWGLIEGRDHYLDPLTLVGSAPVVLLPLTPVRLVGGPGGRSDAAGRW
jgi:murein DD-endopeptidase MepM/ murein hydrolase activator NlpD